MPKLKGLLDSANAKLAGLLGDFPQGFNAGAVAGFPGWAGDMAYLADTARLALTGADSQAAPEDYVGTTDYIAKQAGYPVPQTLSGQLGAAVGGLMSPGPGDLAKFAPLGAMFLGAKAKTALPDVLEYAQAMDKAGKSADEIWQTTGKLGQPWFKGADGKWRFEISDKFDVVETPEGLAEVGANIRSGESSLAGPLGRGDTPSITLAQLMAHNELYGAYPDLRQVDVRMTPESGGQYAATFDRIRLNNDDLKRLGSPQTTDDIQKPSSIALHEVQHAIQEREGFGSGGSIGGNGAPSIYSGKLVDSLSQRAKALEKQLDNMDYLSPEHSALQKEYYALKDQIEGAAAFEGYKRLAGEAEARNTQARMNMTMDERIALPPWVTQDVPTDQQIVRFGDGPAMAIEDFAARRAGKAKPYKELAMDEASRMQRAQEMGFDTPAVHWSRHGVDVNELDSGKFAIAPFDAIGTHTGTPEAAMKRFEGWASPERGAGVTYPVLIKNKKPYLDPEGKPWNEQKLTEHLREIGGYDTERADYKTLNAKLREKIFSEYDSIPYINDVEDAGSVSYITPPQNIRSRWAAFDPKNKDSANLLAGTAAAAVGLGAYKQQEEQRRRRVD